MTQSPSVTTCIILGVEIEVFSWQRSVQPPDVGDVGSFYVDHLYTTGVFLNKHPQITWQEARLSGPIFGPRGGGGSVFQSLVFLQVRQNTVFLQIKMGARLLGHCSVGGNCSVIFFSGGYVLWGSVLGGPSCHGINFSPFGPSNCTPIPRSNCRPVFICIKCQISLF